MAGPVYLTFPGTTREALGFYAGPVDRYGLRWPIGYEPDE